VYFSSAAGDRRDARYEARKKACAVYFARNAWIVPVPRRGTIKARAADERRLRASH
jgi:hypothetical protein